MTSCVRGVGGERRVASCKSASATWPTMCCPGSVAGSALAEDDEGDKEGTVGVVGGDTRDIMSVTVE